MVVHCSYVISLLSVCYQYVIDFLLVFILYRAITGPPPPPPRIERIALSYFGGLCSGAALEHFLTFYAQLCKLSHQTVGGQEPAPSLAVRTCEKLGGGGGNECGEC
jgi:hypothetical protein